MPTATRPIAKTAQSRLAPLADRPLDLIIVGGGISGAAILWDATLRGLRAVLVEKNDYSSGTSQATSKLIHGGLRYLRNGDFGLVRESLRERRLLAKIAPHAVRPMRFLYPVYPRNPAGRFLVHTALSIYGTLALDRNRGLLSSVRLPGYQYVDTQTALELEPTLDPRGMRGAFLYSDYLNPNPERLGCEFMFAAREHGGHCFNYAEVTQVQAEAAGGRRYRVTIRDHVRGADAMLEAPAIINATGPWADTFPGLRRSEPRRLARSKGIHVVVRSIANGHSLALHRPDGTHIFVIPWRGRSILGTTDTRFEDSPDAMRVTSKDVRGVIDDINSLVPAARLTEADVQFFYGGIRPLTDDSGKDTYSASRRTEIEDHAGEGNPGLWTVLGGKYTTSRALAESVVDAVDDYLPGRRGACLTRERTLPAGEFTSRADLLDDLAARFPGETPEKVSTLGDRYGRTAERILRLAGEGSATKRGGRLPAATGEAFYEDELRYLALNEDIHSLSDLYFRRSGLGTVGRPSETVARVAARTVADITGWDARARKRELRAVSQRYALD